MKVARHANDLWLITMDERKAFTFLRLAIQHTTPAAPYGGLIR